MTDTASWAWYPGTGWPGFSLVNQDMVNASQNGLGVAPSSYTAIIWRDPNADDLITDEDTDDSTTASTDRVTIGGVEKTVQEAGRYTGSTIVVNGVSLNVALAVWVFTDGTYMVRLHDTEIPAGHWQDVSAISLGTNDATEYDHSYVSTRDKMFACFAARTAIATPGGPRLAGDLAVGDRVLTLDGGAQRLQWVVSRSLPGIGRYAPILFAPGAVGNARPLRLSAHHRVLVACAQAELMFGSPQVLVPAAALVNGTTIRRAPCATIRYVHFACARPRIIFAEGAPCETLNPGEFGLEGLSPRQRRNLIRAVPGMGKGGQQMPHPCLSMAEGRLLADCCA